MSVVACVQLYAYQPQVSHGTSSYRGGMGIKSGKEYNRCFNIIIKRIVFCLFLFLPSR